MKRCLGQMKASRSCSWHLPSLHWPHTTRRSHHPPHHLNCLSSSSSSSSTSTSSDPEVAMNLSAWVRTGARVTRAAQATWAQVLRAGDTVVDATCGNGHDTLGLAKLVGPTGTVYAMDIQQVAVEATQRRLAAELPTHLMPKLHVMQECHSKMQEVVGSMAARCVVFNLGYFPGSDKRLVTQTSTTVQAVEAALEVVQPGGLVSIMLYHGHEEGGKEAAVVRQLATELSPKYWVCTEARLINRPAAPYLLSIWRMEDVEPPASPQS